MAKQHKIVKASHAVGQKGTGQTFEHQESIDDSLLPDASELARLQELDPDIVSWIKDRTAREQDARHSFNDRRMGLLEVGQKRTYRLDVITVVFAFLIIMAGIGFSAFLIYFGQSVVGTIFAGGTLIFAASAFLNYRKKSGVPPPKGK